MYIYWLENCIIGVFIGEILGYIQYKSKNKEILFVIDRK